MYYTAPQNCPCLITVGANTYQTFASLSLPAGEYSISAKATASNNYGNAGYYVQVACQLAGDGLTGTPATVGLSNYDESANFMWTATLPLQALANFTSTTSVALQCQGSPVVANQMQVYIWWPQITAIPVTNIITQ